MLPRGNKQTANRRIALNAFIAKRIRDGLAKYDKGGGSGRIGTRKHVDVVCRKTKSDLLRPSLTHEA